MIDLSAVEDFLFTIAVRAPGGRYARCGVRPAGPRMKRDRFRRVARDAAGLRRGREVRCTVVHSAAHPARFRPGTRNRRSGSWGRGCSDPSPRARSSTTTRRRRNSRWWSRGPSCRRRVVRPRRVPRSNRAVPPVGSGRRLPGRSELPGERSPERRLRRRGLPHRRTYREVGGPGRVLVDSSFASVLSRPPLERSVRSYPSPQVGGNGSGGRRGAGATRWSRNRAATVIGPALVRPYVPGAIAPPPPAGRKWWPAVAVEHRPWTPPRAEISIRAQSPGFGHQLRSRAAERRPIGPTPGTDRRRPRR